MDWKALEEEIALLTKRGRPWTADFWEMLENDALDVARLALAGKALAEALPDLLEVAENGLYWFHSDFHAGTPEDEAAAERMGAVIQRMRVALAAWDAAEKPPGPG